MSDKDVDDNLTHEEAWRALKIRSVWGEDGQQAWEKFMEYDGGDTLDLNDCNLHTLPDALWNLVNLTHLWISDNQLTTTPIVLGKLEFLTHVVVCDNPLNTGEPTTITELRDRWLNRRIMIKPARV